MSELVPAELTPSYAPQLEVDRGLIALGYLRLSGGSPTQVEREARSLRNIDDVEKEDAGIDT